MLGNTRSFSPLNAARTAVIATAAFGLSGCFLAFGSSGVPLDELDLSGAAPDELSLAAPANVIITEGSTLAIDVEGDQDVIDRLRFDRSGDSLDISHEDSSWSKDDIVTVRVTMARPSSLAIGGSGSIETPSMARDAEIAIGGSGNIDIGTIEADSLEIAIGGSGNVRGAGSTDDLEIAIGGSGNIRFAEMTVNTAEISIGGSGDVEFKSDGEVDASFGGGGKVRVVGNAKCNSSSFGSGKLICGPAETAKLEASE